MALVTKRYSALISLLKARSVEYGEFVLASGQTSKHYIDARRTTMSAEGLELVGDLALELIRTSGWAPVTVGGLTLGADPVAYAISLASRKAPPAIDAFTVRKTPKQHGTARLIEGCFRSGDSVVVVEDVLTTGRSALAAVAAIEAMGGEVIGVLALIDRDEGGRDAIESAGHQTAVLVPISDLGVSR